MRLNELTAYKIRYSKIVVVCLSLIFLLSLKSFAGPPPRDSDIYPKIKLIKPDGNHIWFVPYNRPTKYGLIFRYDKVKDEWQTFCKATGQEIGEVIEVKVTDKDVQFVQQEKIFVFNKKSKKWLEKRNENSGYYKPGHRFSKFIKESSDWVSDYEIDQRTIMIGKVKYIVGHQKIFKVMGEKISFFALPQSEKGAVAINSYEHRDPRQQFTSDVGDKIGHIFKEDGRIWFGINFYDGEGFSGTGGLGYFDTSSEKWTIFRPEILLKSSVKTMLKDGEHIWLATAHSGEYGWYPTEGLVKYNRKTKRYVNFTPKNSNIGGCIIYSLAKIDDDLWMGTEYGISRYNTITNEWKNYSVKDILISGDNVDIYPGIAASWKDKTSYQPAAKAQGGQLFKVVWIDTWKNYNAQTKQWSFKEFYEIEPALKMIGWVKKKDFNHQNKLYRSKGWARFDIGTAIKAEPDTNSENVGYVIAARLNFIKQKDDWIKVTTSAGWIKTNFVIPIVSEVKQGELNEAE